MKSKALFIALVWINVVHLSGQSFQFSMSTTQFVLIPGGGFESRAYVGVPPGDSVILSTICPSGVEAFFQPRVVYSSREVFLVVFSTDTALAPQQTLTVLAQHDHDTVSQVIQIDKINDGHGYYLIDSAKVLLDTAFGYLKHALPDQEIFLGSLEQLPWSGFFPYPPLLIVTHHLFVSGNWRAAVLWHNMVPPDDWIKVFLYNEVLDSCYGVFIDTWGLFSLIPGEIKHYTFQDVDFSIPEVKGIHDLRLHPNPTDGVVYGVMETDCEKSLILKVFNMAGQPIREMLVPAGDFRVDLSGDPPGVYMFMAECSKGWMVEKVIKL